MKKKNERIHFANYISENDIYIHHTLDKAKSTPIKYPTEIHTRIELLFLISGKLDYTINGETFRVHEGDLIIINAHTPHSLKIAPDIPYERILLQFSPTHIPVLKNYNLLELFSHSYNYRHIVPKEILKQSNSEPLLKRICRISKTQEPFKDIKILSIIIDLISELSNLILHIPPTQQLKQPKKSIPLLQDITAYINDNITKKITVEEIAREFNISDSYLYHFFKKQMEMPLHTYIEKQKMQTAKVMILQGNSATFVATYLAYDYYPTFCNQYKRAFGVSPSQHFKNPYFY